MADHRIYVFDLDGTLCHTIGRDYAGATPYPERIAVVNRLFDTGARIIIDSARGSLTGEDWFPQTDAQLIEWGVRYHLLRTGVKFYGDVYIDDKGISDKEFFT
jgi:trehalose-6-phosphatase